MKKLLHIIKENRNIVDILCLLAIAFILSIPMLNDKIDLYLDDGSQHLMRAYGTYQTIKQNGNSNIISSFVNGFGYSWDLFYGPLSSYAIILISMICGSFNVGFKAVIFLIMFLAGSFMYKFIYEMTENKNTSLLAGIIYITSPYFFTDLYVRHAIRRVYGVCIYSNGFLRVV